jgi:hypothetical protein
MRRDTTKPAGDVADAKLFGDWFDLIETDLRTKGRGFIETMIAEALAQDTVLTGVGLEATCGHRSGLTSEERNRRRSLEDKAWR